MLSIGFVFCVGLARLDEETASLMANLGAYLVPTTITYAALQRRHATRAGGQSGRGSEAGAAMLQPATSQALLGGIEQACRRSLLDKVGEAVKLVWLLPLSAAAGDIGGGAAAAAVGEAVKQV